MAYGPDGFDFNVGQIDPLPYPAGPMDPLWGYSDVPGLMPYPEEDEDYLDPWGAPYPAGRPHPWPKPHGAYPQPLPWMPFVPLPPAGPGGVVPGWNLPGAPPPPPRKIDLFKGLFPGLEKSRSQLPMQQMPMQSGGPMQQMPSTFQDVPYAQQLQGLEGYF